MKLKLVELTALKPNQPRWFVSRDHAPTTVASVQDLLAGRSKLHRISWVPEDLPGWQALVEVKDAGAREIIYVAHPVSGDPIGNCTKVCRWVRHLTLLDPTRLYVAPWVAEVLAFPETKKGDATYERALDGDLKVIERFDGVIAVGGRITDGMARERDHALREGKSFTDLSRYATPEDLPEGFFLDPAYEE